MKPPKLTNAEAIAAAALLGCEFWKSDTDKRWYVHDDIDNPHPLERQRFGELFVWGWRTKPALARAFVRYHLEDNNASD